MSTRCRWTRSPNTCMSDAWSRSWTPIRSISPPRKCRHLNEPLEGEFDGIGVVFNMATDTVIVLNVIPSGAERQGGRRGRATASSRIDDSLVAGRTDRPARRSCAVLRGTARLGGAAGARTAAASTNWWRSTVVRDKIPIRSLDGGTDAHRRHRLRQTGPVRADTSRTELLASALDAPHRRGCAN